MSTIVSRSALIVLAFLLAACSTELFSTSSADDVLFLVHKPVEHRSVMEALYQGTVVEIDGCLRFGDEPAGHTVVWPPGFSLNRKAGRLVVRDENGQSVGVIDGSFIFGGGEVPTLWEGGPLTEADRAAALSQCPGRYWIVGEFPSE